MNIEHVFFDLDHTLWDFETNSAKTFDYIFEKNEVDVNLKDFLHIYKPINKKYWKLYREEKVSKKALRYERLKKSFDVLDYKINDRLINHLSKVYIDNLSNYNHLFEGTVEVLSYLAKKYNLHIITNGFEEVQQRKMKNAEIIHFFDKIITSESVAVKKPNPKIFKHALEITNCLPHKSVMIGDSFEADILGALGIGMSAIFFNPDKEKNYSKAMDIANLIEIKQYL